MEQLLLLPTWPDAVNHYTCDHESFFIDMPEPTETWNANWLETPSFEHAAFHLGRFSGMYASRETLVRPLTLYMAGRFVCLRRLKHGPVRKLSQWHQLDVGRAILLHPQPLADDLKLVKGRSISMRSARKGHFNPHVRPDGTLWLERVA